MTPDETAWRIINQYDLQLNPGQMELIAHEIAKAIKAAVKAERGKMVGAK